MSHNTDDRHCNTCDDFCCTCELCKCCKAVVSMHRSDQWQNSEVAHLRALITAWADADDVDNVGWGEHGGEYPSDCSCPYCVAARSLRKVVGR